jgi:hypothetical protein
MTCEPGAASDRINWPVSTSQTLTVPSPAAVASLRPSSVNDALPMAVVPAATRGSRVLRRSNTFTSWPLSTSHTLTCDSLADSSRRPSGLKATLRTGPGCRVYERTFVPVAASHRVVV